jgi:hypothetical protein
MADIEDDDDEFGSDDGLFEDLPPNTLLQLEQQASQYIQQFPRQVAALNLTSNARPTYAANQSQWQGQKQESWQSERTVQNQVAEEEQNYGYDDGEDVIDLDADPYSAPPQRYEQGQTFTSRTQFGAQNVPRASSHAHGQAQAGAANGTTSVADLQAKILQVCHLLIPS